MKRKSKLTLVLVTMILLLTIPFGIGANAEFVKKNGHIKYYNNYGNLVKNTWFRVNKKNYHANKKGYLDIGLKMIDGNLYYFNEKGVNKTGWRTINGHRYYFMKKTHEAIRNKKYKFSSGKTYYFNENGYRLTGWIKIDNHYYYFKPNMKTGWITIGDKKYYCIRSASRRGQRASGIFSISGKLYYFSPSTGELMKNTTVKISNTTYTVNASGICTVKATNTAPSADMLFFLTFESGSEAYNQTGGDHGCACGAYQFDYRYSLLNLVKYAYKKNPIVCKEFQPYAAYKTGTKLFNNSKFYKAWHTIYNRDPKAFAAIQDTFARENYYDGTEKALQNAGIVLSTRPDVVKGAVYSYSIQHGQTAAVNAVKACKLNAAMTNAIFLKKLYAYRIKKFPAYKSRYTAEYKLALTKLK